jgi:hypothetical protein
MNLFCWKAITKIISWTTETILNTFSVANNSLSATLKLQVFGLRSPVSKKNTFSEFNLILR